MNIFNYDAITQEYLSTSTARLDPLDQQPMIPANATSVAVIAPSAGHVAVFNGTSWDDIEDHRGTTLYDTTTQEESTQEELGPIDSQYTELVPTPYTTWSGSAWTLDLPAAQTGEIAKVDTLSEQQRLVYITNGSGQSLTYNQKAAEARTYKTAGYPADLTDYPFIQADVNATGNTSTVVADDIIAAEDLWISKSAAIEELRIKAKLDINAATDMASIDTIVDAFEIAIVLI